MTAADKYYLKARELYPYDMDDVVEALDYGLSHDDAHAGLLNLRGEITYHNLRQLHAAREIFELALYHDPQYADTYYNLIRLLCDLDEAQAAERLIARALMVKGIDKARIWHLEALIYEKQQMYTIALASLGNALRYCQDDDRRSFYKAEQKRVRKKSKPADTTAPVAEPSEQQA